MARMLLGIALILGGLLLAGVAILAALFVFAASASHGGGSSLWVGLLVCAVIGLLALGSTMFGIFTLVTSGRGPPPT